jgi:flagellar biosynthetic protein FliR
MNVLLALARVGPLVAFTPALGVGVWPKLIVAAILTAFVAPSLEAAGGSPLRELLVGATLGLTAAVPFRAAEAAGLLVKRQTGEAYKLFALALFGALGGPRLVVAALARSYAAFPVAGAAPGVEIAIGAGAQLVIAAASIAAPALAAILLVELGIGLVHRAQPAAADALAAPAIRLVAAVMALALAAATAARLVANAIAMVR